MKLGQLSDLLKQLQTAKSQEAVLAELLERDALTESERKEFTAMHIAAQREATRLSEKKL